ncbi:MAG TPA: hypothetical protein ENK49_13310 [Gammaproteobacteria bacterium]|nr:hypothetical protein [Gammaproteobacteria bacterium]
MLRNLLILVVVALGFWLAAQRLLTGEQAPTETATNPPPVLEPIVPPPSRQPRNLVADISVHTEQELDILFTRVEQLLDRPRSENEAPLVSIVLHGPEVAFFAVQNYAKYKGLVDRAAKLAALGAVDISICQTQMRNLGIATDQVPSFLRQVPYGPGEVERLLENGFVSM